MRRQRVAQMSTGLLFITLSVGCSSGSKPNPAPASSGSPTVAAPQATTPPTTQPAGGSGPVVTLTSTQGYVYKLQASPYTGPAITVLGTFDAPPGQVFGAVAVTISDGVADRPEPLGSGLYNTAASMLTLSVPAGSAAAFGPEATSSPCYHDLAPSTSWCDVVGQPAQGTGQPGVFGAFDSGGQLEPGQPLSFLMATNSPVPQAAPMAKLTLFAQVPGGKLVQIPVFPSG